MYSIDGEEGPLFTNVQQERRGGVGEGFLFGSVQRERRGMYLWKCSTGKERDDWVKVCRREGKRCFCRRVQEGRKRISVVECTAEKERDVFNVGLYTL